MKKKVKLKKIMVPDRFRPWDLKEYFPMGYAPTWEVANESINHLDTPYDEGYPVEEEIELEFPLIMSIDAETDGLWGEPFQIGAIVYDSTGKKLQTRFWQLPLSVVENEWVKENVVPNIKEEPTHRTLNAMLESFAKFYLGWKEIGEMRELWHMGHIVEAYLFRLLRNKDLIGDFQGPYLPIELSMLLEMSGHKPDSVDGFLGKSTVHDALVDAERAAKVYFELKKGMA